MTGSEMMKKEFDVIMIELRENKFRDKKETNHRNSQNDK